MNYFSKLHKSLIPFWSESLRTLFFVIEIRISLWVSLPYFFIDCCSFISIWKYERWAPCFPSLSFSFLFYQLPTTFCFRFLFQLFFIFALKKKRALIAQNWVWLGHKWKVKKACHFLSTPSKITVSEGFYCSLNFSAYVKIKVILSFLGFFEKLLFYMFRKWYFVATWVIHHFISP